MKKSFTIIAACLLSATAAFTQNIFTYTYSNDLDYTEWDKAIQLSDGNLCMLGYNFHFDGEGFQVQACLQKTSSTGQVTKAVTNSFHYNGDVQNDFLALAVNTAGGNLAVAGQSISQGLLAKYDVNLNYQWAKQYSIPGRYGSMVGLITTPAQGYVMALQHYSQAYADAIIKTDSAGNVRWSKQYVQNGTTTIASLAQCADGGYVFAEQEAQSGILVVKTDTAGAVVWARHISTPPGGSFKDIQLTCAPSGSIYISAASGIDRYIPDIDFDVTINQPALIKLYANGTLAWDRYIPTTGYITWHNRAVEVDKKGNVLFAGQLEELGDTPQVSHAIVYRADTSGNLLQGRRYPGGASDVLYGFTSLPDSGFVITGVTYDINEVYAAFAFKIDKALSGCGDVADNGAFASLGLTAGSVTLLPVNAGVIATAADFADVGTPSLLGTSLCTVLPVQLLSFSAAQNKDVVNLQWKTAGEQNTAYYTVERSSSSSGAFAPVSNTAARHQATAQVYNAVDEKPLPGTSYYRLRSVDADGKSALSAVVPVSSTKAGVMYISPNPVTGAIHIYIQAAAASVVSLQVTDMSGRVVLAQHKSIVAGSNTITLPAPFSKGMYILKVVENNHTQTLKFIK